MMYSLGSSFTPPVEKVVLQHKKEVNRQRESEMRLEGFDTIHIPGFQEFEIFLLLGILMA